MGWPGLIYSWQFPKLSAAIFPLATVLLYYAVFRGGIINGVMRTSWIAAIGGMCYTIYWLHVPALSLFAKGLRSAVTGRSFANTLVVQTLLLLAPLLVFCGVYFCSSRSPACHPKWPQLLKRRLFPAASAKAAAAS